MYLRSRFAYKARLATQIDVLRNLTFNSGYEFSKMRVVSYRLRAAGDSTELLNASFCLACELFKISVLIPKLSLVAEQKFLLIGNLNCANLCVLQR